MTDNLPALPDLSSPNDKPKVTLPSDYWHQGWVAGFEAAIMQVQQKFTPLIHEVYQSYQLTAALDIFINNLRQQLAAGIYTPEQP